MKKERFTIDAWLQDMSRKVVDEDGDSIDPCVCSLGWLLERQNRIFIVTPEEEMTVFEKKVYAYCDGKTVGEELIKRIAKELLSLARDQFIKDGYVIEKRAFQDAVEKVDPEVMKGVSDKVDMEEDLRLEYERGKAEALKNLPRWREWGNGAAGNSDGHPIALVSGAGGIRFVSVLGVTGEKYIMLDDLKKLPGFKEDDSHE